MPFESKLMPISILNNKIDLIESKIEWSKCDLKSNQDYIITLNLKYNEKIEHYDFKDNSILKLIKNTKQLVRYYQKRIISLNEDLIILTKKLNNRKNEAVI